jgi:hypothetical protein
MAGVDPGDDAPDQAGGDDHRLGLAQVGELFRHHQQVSEDEQPDREVAGPVIGQVEGFGRLAAGKGSSRQQQDRDDGHKLGH